MRFDGIDVCTNLGTFRSALLYVPQDLGARRILADGGSPLEPPLPESYGDAGTRATSTY